MNHSTSMVSQVPLGIQDQQTLVTAFQQFSQLSEQLQQSYQELDRRAADLTEELATARDERLRQLAEKEKLADRLEKLLAALPAGVVVLDSQQMIQTANTAAEAFFEQPLVGKNWLHLYKTSIQRSDGQDLYLKSGRVLSINQQSLESDNGKIILLQDITENHMLQDMVNQQHRLAAMGEMAAGLAHQLRTPLASAVLYASQLDHKNVQREQHSKAVDKIRTSLRYLEKLINDMLLYAKGGEFGDASFSLSQLLISFNARIETRMQQSDSQLRITSQLTDVSLKGSQDALVSVLVNLAENAMDACDQDCQIELKVYQQAEYLILAMCDNGPGLSIEQQLHIFEPFYTERSEGTGLGLAVAQSIAQAHQGELMVKSAIGEGSNFYLCLPLQQGEQFLPSGKMTHTANLAGQLTGEFK